MDVVDGSTPEIRVRRFELPDGFELPRWWYGDRAFLTHASNALTLVFPAGEQFFIRSVRRFAHAYEDDPELAARVRAFAGQEAQHGRAHASTFELLEAQGFEIRSFLAWYEHLAFEVLEPRVPPVLSLSVTAALEHFTATLATQSFTRPFLDEAHPVMRELLLWHSAEEIEHKSVAFDVLQRVDDRYAVRVAGLLVASGSLVFFWNRATRHLLKQEPGMTRARVRAERKALRARGQSRTFLREGFLSYLRPGFHPDQVDNRGLARAWLKATGRLDSVSVTVSHR